MLSVLDIFRVGIGPSSSHTVGPMRIALRFLNDARNVGALSHASRCRIDLQGSLALTGVGHRTDMAVILGLLGFEPDSTDPDKAALAIDIVQKTGKLELFCGPEIAFDPRSDIDFRSDIIPPLHPNGISLSLLDSMGKELLIQQYYSVGGGFIAQPEQLEQSTSEDRVNSSKPVPFDYLSAEDLLNFCTAHRMSIMEVILNNEDTWRSREQTLSGLDKIWDTMNGCIERGLSTSGILPGGLEVERRAPALYLKLQSVIAANDPENVFDHLNVYALAVNEENAAGGRVVTAPTNGAAGIIPAVIRHYCAPDGVIDRTKVRNFLLTAGAIGLLFKQRASISGAEMGCQGEVGVACAMAAGGLTAIWGGTPEQIEHAAEIGMEHNLGLTCDPVGGLVQIPCIERNAIAAVKAVNASRLAFDSTGAHKVSLDQVIETMRQTGHDMNSKYKETSQGGLAVNVIEC